MHGVHDRAKTRLIAIANPNNPTGAVASAEDLLLIAAARPRQPCCG